ncbi:peroxiredoxin (alkyl hydroperoxide reductase subunit C) [Thermosediminibacter litoriperuensis]|uniref:Peroxiredoxin (Alkyl hydroperoxide reductase subunit C) n=2 Tax=Thermosediminibacter litoriperuensis TaxID=291989 RepID=A0A5S5APL7_9FIRM|nr:peroxiredoxin (alkyl hydroperoxide reductase subunit C) [Thermosediminibacter litoriperuensis]
MESALYTSKHCLQRGDPAPDFEAQAYCRGNRITVRLSDYRGQWVMLFFYSSDFTFV